MRYLSAIAVKKRCFSPIKKGVFPLRCVALLRYISSRYTPILPQKTTKTTTACQKTNTKSNAYAEETTAAPILKSPVTTADASRLRCTTPLTNAKNAFRISRKKSTVVSLVILKIIKKENNDTKRPN